eukprot:3301703-Pyramimonas_sp.AAC.1
METSMQSLASARRSVPSGMMRIRIISSVLSTHINTMCVARDGVGCCHAVSKYTCKLLIPFDDQWTEGFHEELELLAVAHAASALGAKAKYRVAGVNSHCSPRPVLCKHILVVFVLRTH